MTDKSQASLILLAIIKQIPNATREFVLDCSVNSLYLDYFTAAEAFDALLKQHLIHFSVNKSETEKTVGGKAVSRINLTPEGEAVYNVLESSLPEQLIDYLNRLTHKESKADALKAKYQITGNLDYLVTLSQKNGRENVILLELHVPSEQIAQQICQNWQNKAPALYAEIMKLLSE